MRRRELLTVLGGAAVACPIAVRAQLSASPVIGFLDSRSPDAVVNRLRAFHQGLKEAGFVDGENVSILHRWAENRLELLPTLAADLVRRQVAVIVTPGAPATTAAKAGTTTIPVAFILSEDPVKHGFVASLNRPGGNITGVNFLSNELAAKRLEFLRELVPKTARIAVLVNPAETMRTTSTLQEVEAAARAIGLEGKVFNANTHQEIDAAFKTIGGEQHHAVFVAGTPFFNVRVVQLALLAMFYRLPVVHGLREYCEAGGLMSYGSNLADAYRQCGVYVGRILKGTIPAELPIFQSLKVELVINAFAARLLGLSIPQTLMVSADEVIE